MHRDAENMIVHLDDHQIFSNGFQLAVLPFFPSCRYIHFQHPDDTLRFIQEAFSKAEKIDVIVTDINHPGTNGYEFAKEVQALKQKYAATTLVMLVTMVGEEHPLIQEG